MTEGTFNLIIGLLLSLIGIILTIYAFQNEPRKDQSESTRSANIQMKILGIGLFIVGLIWAF